MSLAPQSRVLQRLRLVGTANEILIRRWAHEALVRLAQFWLFISLIKRRSPRDCVACPKGVDGGRFARLVKLRYGKIAREHEPLAQLAESISYPTPCRFSFNGGLVRPWLDRLHRHLRRRSIYRYLWRLLRLHANLGKTTRHLLLKGVVTKALPRICHSASKREASKGEQEPDLFLAEFAAVGRERPRGYISA